LEKPGDVGAMPFGRRGVRHRLHDLVFRRQMGRPPLRLATHAAKSRQPILALLIKARLGSLGAVPRKGRSCGARHEGLLRLCEGHWQSIYVKRRAMDAIVPPPPAGGNSKSPGSFRMTGL